MMTAGDRAVCRICGEGHLDIRVKKNMTYYKGTESELDLVYSVCNNCGSEQAADNQLRTNKRAKVKFKKSVDGLLTGGEVRAIREKLKLNQSEAALVFGGGPVAFSKYENDDVTQSEAMDKMIRLAAALPAAFDYLARQAGIKKMIAGTKWEALEGLTSVPTARHRPELRVVENKVNHEHPSYAA
ncbi:type II toxin-antitoxin system MqsA family antitoxin [Pseudohongiella nitratireducens]|uniref:type II toxin-antitoxin system MqsA family antitoxin n=1 Tax=Pseudohongiella nitratireducens TaxID=1768907 RepID=UPI0030EB12B9|tara:strand:- start:759 stop:1313 length:555 start_codon:yes stop_codon:yes gene_type:complete